MNSSSALMFRKTPRQAIGWLRLRRELVAFIQASFRRFEAGMQAPDRFLVFRELFFHESQFDFDFLKAGFKLGGGGLCFRHNGFPMVARFVDMQNN